MCLFKKQLWIMCDHSYKTLKKKNTFKSIYLLSQMNENIHCDIYVCMHVYVLSLQSGQYYFYMYACMYMYIYVHSLQSGQYYFYMYACMYMYIYVYVCMHVFVHSLQSGQYYFYVLQMGFQDIACLTSRASFYTTFL